MIDLDRFFLKLRYGHPLQLVFDAISKFGIRITPFYLFLETISPENPPKLPAGFEGYEVGFWGPKEMKAIALIQGRRFSEADLLERLKSGQKCFGLKKNTKLAAFTWFDLKEVSTKLPRFPLKKDEAYEFDIYTLMAFRGKGIAGFLKYHQYKELEKIGCTKLYSYVDYFNTPGVKIKLKLRAKKVKLILYIVLFNKWSFHYFLKDYQKKSN